MGLFSGIGKFVGNVARGVAKVAGAVSKVANFIKQPLDLLMAPVKNVVGNLLDKLPFGIGNLVKPFVDKFLDSAVSFLAAGPLGGLSFLAQAMPTIEKIADLAEKVGSVATKVADQLSPQATSNLAHTFAYAQAQKLYAA